MRFARYNEELTKAAGFKDRRSRIGVTFSGSMLVRLAGRDMMALHDEVFERDKDCVDRFQEPLMGECSGPHELSHDVPRGRGGSDTPENTKRRCQRHHRFRDLHGCPEHY